MYEIGGRRFAPDQPGFAEALATAHEQRLRPRCMCTPLGAEMYVARLGNGHIVKRMPGAGDRHHPECPSYEPPWELSGRGEVMGKAIVEDPTDGSVTLRLDFPLTRQPGRSVQPASGDGETCVKSDGTKLTLKGLLHYLWDEAELTHWHPRFGGARTWALVRKRLLQASEGKVIRGQPLTEALYIPEVFTVERRDEIKARRLRRMAMGGIAHSSTRAQALMLLLGEVKEIAPARFGHKAVIKHVPDQPFAMDATLFRRMERRHASDLTLWAARGDLRLVVIAVFDPQGGGIPTVTALALMPVNRCWIPVEDSFACDLVDHMIDSGHAFRKCMSYNSQVEGRTPSALLLNGSDKPSGLHIVRPGEEEPERGPLRPDTREWVWRVAEDAMPPLSSERRIP
jgi:hypothetical protein